MSCGLVAIAPFLVDDPAPGHELVLAQGDFDLSVSNGASGHVDDDWGFFVSRKCDGDRVGSEHSLRAPKRCDELGRVGHRPADKIALERLQWVVASDAEVVCVADTDPAGAVLLGFVHGDAICLWPDDETQTVVAIDRCHTGFLAGNFYLRPRIDSAQFEHLEIGMEPGDAVRIYSPQVALRQNIRCLVGISFRHTEIPEHFGGEVAQIISRVRDRLVFVIHRGRIEVQTPF